MTMTNKEVAKIPTDVLLSAAKERKQQLRDSFGLYATTKVLTTCPGCGEDNLGKRELIRHKKDCKKWAKLKETRKASKGKAA